MSGTTPLTSQTIGQFSGRAAVGTSRLSPETSPAPVVDSRDAELARLRQELADRNQELTQLRQQVQVPAPKTPDAGPTLTRLVDAIAAKESEAMPAAGTPAYKEMLGRILDQSMAALGSSRGSVMLYDAANNELSVSTIRGSVPEEVRQSIESGETKCRTFKPGEGLAGKAFQSGQTAVELNVKQNSAFSDTSKTYLDNLFCIPLTLGGQRVGVLNLSNHANGGAFSADELHTLQASLAQVQNERDALNNIGRACIMTDEPKALCGKILEQAMSLVGASKGSVMLYDRETDSLKVEVFQAHQVLDGTPDSVKKDVESGKRKTVTLRPGEGIAGRAFATRKPVIDMLTRQGGGFKDAEKSFTDNILCVPLVNPDGSCLGVINMTNRVAGGPFTQEDADRMQAVTGTATIAINNARRMQRLSVDSLTGIASRSATEEYLEQQLAVHGDRPVSVLVMDLDHFKEVNDTASDRHTGGDQALKEVAQRLRGVVGDRGLVGRWGGDEFVAVLPDTDRLAAESMGDRLRKAVKDTPVVVQGIPFQLDLSVGLSVADGWSPTTARTLFDQADNRMYTVKSQHHGDEKADDRQLELWNLAS